MKYMIILLCVLASGYSYAQKTGSVVLNSGETITGTIKVPSSRYGLHHSVTIIPDAAPGKKRKFSPDEVSHFTADGVRYESQYISESNSGRKFLKVVVDGYVTLYTYASLETNAKGVNGDWKESYYAMKENELTHAIHFSRIRKGEDDFFHDNLALVKDVRAGRYSSAELPKIVERYNSERVQNSN